MARTRAPEAVISSGLQASRRKGGSGALSCPSRPARGPCAGPVPAVPSAMSDRTREEPTEPQVPGRAHASRGDAGGRPRASPPPRRSRRGHSRQLARSRPRGSTASRAWNWLSRLERRFGAAIPEAVMTNAETARELLPALLAGGRRARAAPSVRSREAGMGTVDAIPAGAATLLEAVDFHAQHHGDRVHVELCESDGEPLRITFATLVERAERIAAGLVNRGLEPGQAAALMLPTGADYLATFLGVQMAGAIPVPIYPPARPSQLEDHVSRHAGILANATARALVTFGPAIGVSRLLTRSGPGPGLGGRRRRARRGRQAPGPPGSRRILDRVPPVHLREHRQPQGRGAQSRRRACIASSHGRRARRHAARRLRELAAPLSRHGVDRGMDGEPVLRLSARAHVTARLSCPSGALARSESTGTGARCPVGPTSPTSCACGASSPTTSKDSICRAGGLRSTGPSRSIRTPWSGLRRSSPPAGSPRTQWLPSTGLRRRPLESHSRRSDVVLGSRQSTPRPSRAAPGRCRCPAGRPRMSPASSPAGLRSPASRSGSSTSAAPSCESVRKARSSSAALRRPPAITAIRPPAAHCSTTTGFDRGTAATLPAASSMSPDGTRDLIVRARTQCLSL